jgi:hypothetical protein
MKVRNLYICTLEPHGGGDGVDETKESGDKIKLDGMQLFSCCLPSGGKSI